MTENEEQVIGNDCPKLLIKIKKTHPDAVIPQQANAMDAGYDLVAIDNGVVDPDGRFIEYDTGIAVEPPVGFHVEIYPRSSISKFDLMLANSVGIVDVGYRASLKMRFRMTAPNAAHAKIYKKGDKIGQLKIEKTIYGSFVEVSELSDTERGMGGFGSSDAK